MGGPTVQHGPHAWSVPFDNSTNGFTSETTQEAIEEARITSSGKLLDFEFSSSGNTADKWLNVGHPSVNSNDVPFVSEWSGKIIGLSFSNSNDDSQTDIMIYINSVFSFTWEVRNKKTAWKVLADGMANITQGDRVSIYAGKVSGVGITNPASINGEVVVQVATLPDGNGGTQYGD